MGLFSRKQKITIDDMAMKMMLSVNIVIDKLKYFNNVDDVHAIMVNTGYFYGFLKLHLTSKADLNIAKAVVDMSIAYLEDATKEDADYKNMGMVVKNTIDNMMQNMRSAKSQGQDFFARMAMCYREDIYETSVIMDFREIVIAESNIKVLYDFVSRLTKKFKIVR